MASNYKKYSFKKKERYDRKTKKKIGCQERGFY